MMIQDGNIEFSITIVSRCFSTILDENIKMWNMNSTFEKLKLQKCTAVLSITSVNIFFSYQKKFIKRVSNSIK